MSLAVAPGDLIADKYRVEGVIGRGGMGVVVAAMHLQLDRRVAIKLLHPEVLRNPELVERFAREARAAGKIQSEHVARVLDVGTLPDGAPFMVMEHLAGSDLSAVVKQRGALPLPSVVEYVLQACEALAEAHVAGIVHRDLKPANLFLTSRADGSPSIKILDFGISKVGAAGEGQGITRTSAMMGSPSYMAPEQLKSARDVDARTDVWALGIILHELLTGEGAFRADTVPELYVAILQKPPTPLRALRPEAPPAMEAVILRCLEKDPARRFASVAGLAAALGELAPPRARPSVDRIARIIGGRAPTAFAPTVLPPAAPPGSAPPGSAPSGSAPPPARASSRPPTPSPPSAPQPSDRPPAAGGSNPPREPAPLIGATQAQAPAPFVRAELARSQPRGHDGGAPRAPAGGHGHAHGQPQARPPQAYPLQGGAFGAPGGAFGAQGGAFGAQGGALGPRGAPLGPPPEAAEPRLSSAAIVLIVLVAFVVLGGGSCVACFVLGAIGREGQSSAARHARHLAPQSLGSFRRPLPTAGGLD